MEHTRDHCCALDTPRNRDRALEKSGSLPSGWLRCPRWGSLPLSGVPWVQHVLGYPWVTAPALFCSALCGAADPADGGCGHTVWPEGARRQAGARPQHHPDPLRRAPPGRGGNLGSISPRGLNTTGGGPTAGMGVVPAPPLFSSSSLFSLFFLCSHCAHAQDSAGMGGGGTGEPPSPSPPWGQDGFEG